MLCSTKYKDLDQYINLGKILLVNEILYSRKVLSSDSNRIYDLTGTFG